MPVYFVTGKLGAGKTLIAVRRMQEYLEQGRVVATNIDLDLEVLCKVSNKSSRVIRIPDKPSSDDMYLLGAAYEGEYDESKFGLVVLDELGTWLNSRSWNDKTRKAFIDWLIHARKLRWDIIFLVQNIEMVDKQVKDALCEYLVVCRRMDRIKFAGVHLPKIHSAAVYYGHSENPKLLEEKWRYRGKDLYAAYDTSQVFSPFYEDGLYSMLPPGYTRQLTEQDLKKERKRQMIVRSSPIFGIMLIVAIVAGMAYYYTKKPDPVAVSPADGSYNPAKPQTLKLSDRAGEFTYQGYAEIGADRIYFLQSSIYGRISSVDITELGGRVFSAVGCTASIMWSDSSITVANCRKVEEEVKRKPTSLF